jgi:hypothetical protein
VLLAPVFFRLSSIGLTFIPAPPNVPTALSFLVVALLTGGAVYATPLRACMVASLPDLNVLPPEALRSGGGCWAQQAATVETSEKEVKSMKSLEEAGRLIATTQQPIWAIGGRLGIWLSVQPGRLAPAAMGLSDTIIAAT